MVKRLAQKHHGIACEENYHDSLLAGLRKDEFPCLTYTRDLQDWRDFIRRSPEEYEAWIDGCTRGCTIFELQILEIADRDHVVILLADPEVSVNRFFDRPDREKQFPYQLLLSEDGPEGAMENFRACRKRVNSPERYAAFLHSGFPVLLRDDRRKVEETLSIVEKSFKLCE